MTETDVWNVDRVAAAELLASLRETAEADWADVMAQAFSRCRFQSYQWAAKRVHESAIKVLEAAASREFCARDSHWSDGYRYAEQKIYAATPLDLLGADAQPVRTKGQILRSLLRAAKQKSGSDLPR